MSQRFRCKEPGYNEEIVFEYSPVEATLNKAIGWTLL